MKNGTKRDKVGNLLIGNYTATFDKSGRIKIPEKFRSTIEEHYGKEIFITSLTDEAIQVYPLSVWEKITGIANRGLLHLKPDIRLFMLRVNRKGVKYEIDSKGRILISQSLREKANLNEEIEVIGLNDHLEIWNKDNLDERLEKTPLTDEDFNRIAELQSKEHAE